MYLVTITYTQPIAQIEAKTVEHRIWLDQHVESGLIVLAGPKVPRTGGVLILRGGLDREDLAALLDQDPFRIAGLADYDVVEFTAGKFNPALADLRG